MVESRLKLKISVNEKKPFYKLFIFVIIIITIFLMILRIIFALIPPELLSQDLLSTMIAGRDIDYKILLNWMENGLFELYMPPPGYPYGHFYLYHWYFIFYPFYIMPIWVSYFVWDFLRLASTIFVAYRFYKITSDIKEAILFYIFCGIGYAVDMYYNNTNWLILLLLFESYLQYNKGQKLVSGILCTIATYKIFVVIFPFVLLITKKIKLKDLLYFLCPFIILVIPYLINPGYFIQMYNNWNYSFASTDLNIILRTINVFLKLFEPAQLVFVSFMVLVLVFNLNRNVVKDEKWKTRILILAVILETVLFITYLVFLGIFASS